MTIEAPSRSSTHRESPPTPAIPAFGTLLNLLESLEADKLDYRLSHPRPETIMIEIAVPGERWEVEVFEDGHVEFERFRSEGSIGDATDLERELARHR
jgi:hypothetical protein